MFILLLLGLSQAVSSSLSTCVGVPSNQCSCNLTSGSENVALGDLNAQEVDWRVVVLAGLTGLLGSSLVVIGVALIALWKAGQKINPDLGNEHSKPSDPKRPRPISNTSSSNDSWATPRRRISTPIDR
ncbi:hypothetical protein ElyMa_006811600 [Elysia marginata]|uniref:Uncharacterized protein n=1 Tax=Elysia marginata TaxID=1093978 RepID=A0AAV4J3S9_9GAST|nr:hypothetical protein ElyMa_006811600 [Elysia marginata]